MNALGKGLWAAVVLAVFLIAPASVRSGNEGDQRGLQHIVRNKAGRKIMLYRESHALIIGVSHYTAGWTNLEGVPAELERVEQILRIQGFKVVKVIDPDSRRLEEAFESFIDQYGYYPENRLLFFFAGHGHSMDQGRKGYLVPADAPDPRENRVDFLRKALDMTQILAWSRKMVAKHVLFLFDSCFSGSIFKTRNIPEIPPQISEVTSKPVRQFITAGGANQTVPSISVFIPAFIRALKGEGDLDKDGYVTGTELGHYIHNKVLYYDTGQTPQYGKIRDPDLDEGDFVFISGGSVLTDHDRADAASDLATGVLRVETGPSGAMVFIDGYRRDLSPLTLQGLAAGTAEIKVVKEGYREIRQTVRIRPGQETSVSLFLEELPRTGVLNVRSRPSGAGWYLDGVFVGRTPDGLDRVRPGRHEVAVKMSGRENWTQTVLVRAGQTENILAELAEAGRIANSQGQTFVLIPAGKFMMGSRLSPLEVSRRYGGGAKRYNDEHPLHEVEISEPFYIQTTEVTVGQWRAFARASGYETEAEREGFSYFFEGQLKQKNGLFWDNPGFYQTDDHPVSHISWNDATQYINWLNKQEKDGVYSLPTEAQWEYAARGGTEGIFFWGDRAEDACLYGNLADRTTQSQLAGRTALDCNDGYLRTSPAGAFQANGFGLYDLIGNVWEWCQDMYHAQAYGRHAYRNPIHQGNGLERVGRGGGWNDTAASCRPALRGRSRPNIRVGDLGFRLVRSP